MVADTGSLSLKIAINLKDKITSVVDALGVSV